MTDTKHTPTPLIAADGYIFDADHNIVGKTYDRRYNAHIVKCVNMHDELVEAIQDLICTGEFRRGCEDLKSARETLKKAGAL